jgi:glycosyltransferase involved in cell wall biosynthesis
MRIVNILPRGMHFGPTAATAIDLCVRDFVAHSVYRSSTTVLAEPVETPFADISYRPVQLSAAGSHRVAALRFADAARQLSPDIVIVQHHVPSASALARNIAPVPVLLHRHNLQTRVNPLKRLYHAWQFNALAKTIWVSDVARQSFVRQHPSLASRAVTVHSGLDLLAWLPAQKREAVVLCVGRATPDKGILQAATGICAILKGVSSWRTRFILSRLDRNEDYLQSVRQALAPLGARAEVLTDQPHEVVKRANETAAVALVPSIFPEPFGRTAIEAFAGGAALISSRSGGLPEVVGNCAHLLAEVTSQTVAKALTRLIENEPLRMKLAAGGRKRAAECFDIVKQSHQLDVLYEKVLANSRPA